MQFQRRFVVPVLCALLFMTAVIRRAEAKSTPLNYTATGTFEPTLFVFPDGTQGDSITLQGTSTAGPITVHEWATGSTQTVFPPCVPSSGAAGTLGDFADSFEVITFQNGDVLLQSLVSGTECNASVSGPPIPFEGTLIVTNVGGTGKFAGASGTETLNFAGQYYVCGATGCVGYVQHNETGRVTTP
jgi:hypothetical protein